MTPDKKVRAPKHLTAPTRRWFEAIMTEFDLDSHHVLLLRAACEAWDRCQAARETIATQGTVVTDKHGRLWAHPAVAIERDSRTSFLRCLRELALDIPAPDSRPPVRPGGSIY